MVCNGRTPKFINRKECWIMKCLIIDVVSPAISEELGKYMQVDTKILPSQAELAGMIGDYEVLIMRVDPAINKEILDAANCIFENILSV